MAEALTTAIALPVALTGSPVLIVTDSGAGSPRTVTLDNLTYRHFLAYPDPTVTTGTEADPHEWGAYLTRRLNNNGALALWALTLGTDGRWTIFYGGTGTGQVQWDGAGGTSKVPRHMTGFTGNISVGAGLTTTATHQPFGFVGSVARGNDTGWSDMPQKFFGAEMPDGSVYGWSDGYVMTRRGFDLRLHPKDYATKSTRTPTPAGTPMHPASFAQRTQPSLTIPSTYVLPFSVWEGLTLMPGKRCGFTDSFASLVAASSTAFDDVYLTVEHASSGDHARPSAPNFDALWDWTGVKLWGRAQGTR